MEWPTKDILISFKPLVFEKRMDIVWSSSKWIDSLLSMNHWHNDENSLFKTFFKTPYLKCVAVTLFCVCILLKTSSSVEFVKWLYSRPYEQNSFSK